MERYSIITDGNPREIVLLRGNGCKWRRCSFCDYHLDFSRDENSNFELNKKELSRVKGIYHCLEVINSGSFCDLDEGTIKRIISLCHEKNITELHFECHYMHRDMVPAAKERFRSEGIKLLIKTGAETFDVHFRDDILQKGFEYASPVQIAEYADEVCLLFGLSGQTADSMMSDIRTGLDYFDRVCINIMNSNSTSVCPDPDVISVFDHKVLPLFKSDTRLDILHDNTDFGVGTKIQEVLR